MADDEIHAEIGELEREREALHQREPDERADPKSLVADRERLQVIEERLDQLWDELRQRRALRDAGRDPDEASVRPVDEVEHYQQ
jgi:hypothetical protein